MRDAPHNGGGTWFRRGPAAPEPVTHGVRAPEPAPPPGAESAPRPQTPQTPGAPSDGQSDTALIRASLAVVEPHVEELAVYFYAILFARYPAVRALFPANMDVQRDRLLRALLRIVELVDDPESLTRFCSHLGRDHRKFGTQAAHYPAVGECLLDTLARFAGPAWTPEIAGAWERAYGAVADIMVRAAEQDAQHSPAVWNARVIGHVRHQSGIAEITVQPDQPYFYTAGQYLSVESPWWPREWRHYSPAHAPRADSVLTFHIRSVPGGRVSQALVDHTSVGDWLRVGPPQGDMAIDPASRDDLLCVAGGTGLAPIRALIEEVARQGISHRRSVDLFVGARTAEELYGLDDMLRMSQRHPWLTVRAAVSEQNIVGRTGSLPQVLAEFGPWHRHEAYLSGPQQMISAAADVLLRRGLAPEKLHYDPWGAPALASSLRRARAQEEEDQL
ncbi:globin domain-containing protein [Streptomyces sp. NPDC006649]|uniref:globin domain-containing protein n=1 Tax=unclassified Streptomyces TaxID=2593676 RepID=UPI003245858A